MPAAAPAARTAPSTGSSTKNKNKNTANGETPSNNNDALTTTTANAPAPTLRAINPFLHIYDPTALPEDATTTTDKSKTAHIPSLLPGVRAPAVILLFGFMDGPLRIMSKYVNQYTARFPASTLLLQLSTSKSFFISQEERSATMRKIVQLVERAQERALARRDLRRKIREIEGTRGQRSLDSEEQREVRRLKALQIKAMSGSQLNVAASGVGGESLSISKMGAFEEGEDGEDAEESDLAPELRTPRGLLIHSFSDGGARNLWALLNELSPSSSLRSPKARLPPLRTLILDSSPGYQTASTSALALTIPLQKKYAAWIVFLVRAGVWAYIRVALAWRMYVRRLPTDSERMRAALNSPGKWGWGWASASASSDNEEGQWKLPPRLYLYSRADVLIPWKQVERHARDAARIQVDDTHANPERIEQESGEVGKQEKSALQAAARAGTVDPEMAKWAELSAKFETSFSKSREGSTTTTTTDMDTGADTGAVVRKEETGVRLVRWEKAAHCDLGRHDLLGYWRSVDAWLARV